MPKNQKEPSRWEMVSESVYAECKVFDVYKRHCKHPKNGKDSDFFYLKSRDWALCLPITVNREIILIQQYRFGIDDVCWEIPGGIVDENESPIEAAKRELQEETGYTGESAYLLNSCHANPAILNNKVHYVLIENCTLTQPTYWDTHEELIVQPMPLQQVFEMVTAGEITHSVTLNGLFYLALHLQKIP